MEDAQVEQEPVWINPAVDDRMEMKQSQVFGGDDLDEDDLVAVDDRMEMEQENVSYNDRSDLGEDDDYVALLVTVPFCNNAELGHALKFAEQKMEEDKARKAAIQEQRRLRQQP